MTEKQSVREREGEMSAERVRDEQIYSIKVERKRDGQSGGREVKSVKCVGIVVSERECIHHPLCGFRRVTLKE